MSMKIVYLLVYTYIAYYTMRFAMMVWKNGNKLAGTVITILAACEIIIPIVVNFIVMK